MRLNLFDIVTKHELWFNNSHKTLSSNTGDLRANKKLTFLDEAMDRFDEWLAFMLVCMTQLKKCILLFLDVNGNCSRIKHTHNLAITCFNCRYWIIKLHYYSWSVCVWFRIYVDLAVFQPYLDLEAGDNQSLKIQVARRGIEPRSSCSASQELNHSATAAPIIVEWIDPTSSLANIRYGNSSLLLFKMVIWTQ